MAAQVCTSWVSNSLNGTQRDLMVIPPHPWERHGVASSISLSTSLKESPAYTWSHSVNCFSFRILNIHFDLILPGTNRARGKLNLLWCHALLKVCSFIYLTNIYWTSSICQAHNCIMIYFQINWKPKRLFFLCCTFMHLYLYHVDGRDDFQT